jgi:PAS domain S-box-containing protein
MDGKPLANVHLAESLLTIFASRIATELERQQYELMLVEQTRLLEAVSTGQPLDDCLGELCSSISKLSPSTRACVLLTDTLRLKFPRSITPDFPPSLSQGFKDTPIDELAIGTCGTAVYCGQPVTCTDIANDERWSAGWRDLCIAHGIRACHSVPIMGIDNLPLGSLMLCFNEARLPTDWEYKLGEFGTKIASIAIERLRSIEKLWESEERLNLALTAADMATWDADLSTGKTIWSGDRFQILGYDPATDGAPTVKMWLNRIHPDDRSSVMQTWAIAHRERSLFCSEHRFVRADTGAVVWVAATGRFLASQAGAAIRFVGVMFDISLRKQAEIAVVESQQRSQAILDAIPHAVWVLGADGEFRSNNQQWLNYYGMSFPEATATGWSQVDPDELAATQQLWQLSMQTGMPYEAEFCWHFGGESKRCYLTRAEPIRDRSGEIVEWVGTNTDITHLKQIEAALQESQEFVQKIAETLPGMLYVYDPIEQRNIYINRQSLEVLGYTPEQLQELGSDISATLVHPDDLASMTVYLEGFQAVQIGEVREWESRRRHANGKWRWLLTRSTVFGKTPVGDTQQIIGISIDITERKQAEAALLLYQERLAFVLNNTGMGRWLNSLPSGALDWDERNRELLFVPPDVEPTSELFWSRVHPEDREQTRLAIEAALRDRTLYEIDHRVINPDTGEIRWVRSAGKAKYAPDGKPISFDGISYDITDRKRAEAALAERNNELNSFAHTVSHDLKAPLRAISNLSFWIEEDLEGQLPPDTQQQFQLLRTRVKRMESMIDSLLLYARAGRQEAQLETFDLAELLSEIIDSLAPPESFSIEIQPPLPKLTTKRVFLSQVFANLISNAIKHHTSVTGHLHIWAIEHPDCHEFIVTDDGPGIAPEHHEKIFAIFQTLAGRDNSDSTGIGLAIVKKIVETEQGTIRLESSLGEGTTFYVTWPKSHQ